MTNENSNLYFDGAKTYIEIPNALDFSVTTTGQLTVSAWIKPETLTFPHTEGSGYVHWLGKGETGQQEWTFRIYSQGNTENRENRISFYVFNPEGGLGVGSYFQDTVQVGEWIQVTGVADNQSQQTTIYKDGIKRHSDVYTGKITPEAGNAPPRIGTRDLNSFFQGEIREVRVWNRLLTDSEIADLYNTNNIPTNGLIAEYLLTQDIAPDSAGSHNGIIYFPTWISS